MQEVPGKQWWWFDPDNAAEKCETALYWETTRRTKSYPAFWRKCVRVSSAFFPTLGKPKLSEMLGLMHLHHRVKTATSDECFKLVLDGFDPKLTWLDLTENQRLKARGYVIGGAEPIKVNHASTLPGKISKPSFIASISLCQIDRNSAGGLFVSNSADSLFVGKSRRAGIELKHAPQFWPFQGLRLATPGDYLCVYFDTRVSRERLLAELSAPTQFWKSTACSGSTRIKASAVHVIPSDVPPFAFLIAPASCDLERLVSAVHSKLGTEKREEWLAQCVAYWRTVKVKTKVVRRNPDGTIPLNAKGLPDYEIVTRCPFEPAKHLTPKLKPGKSPRLTRLWLGLAVDDLVRARKPLFKKSPETDFLIYQSETWRAYCNRSMKAERKNYQEEREVLQKSRHELRNLQTSAKKQLDKLNESLGRLDKNLDHCLKQNAALAAFFSAAAAGWGESPTSKTSAS